MVEQGDIIKVTDIKYTLLVISKNSYNKMGQVIVCPISAEDRPSLTRKLLRGDKKEYVYWDSLRTLDIGIRGYSIKGRVSTVELFEIISNVQSIFDFI